MKYTTMNLHTEPIKWKTINLNDARKTGELFWGGQHHVKQRCNKTMKKHRQGSFSERKHSKYSAILKHQRTLVLITQRKSKTNKLTK